MAFAAGVRISQVSLFCTFDFLNLSDCSGTRCIDAKGAAMAMMSDSGASDFKRVSLAEWFKAFASKANGVSPREFESHSSTVFCSPPCF